VAEAELIRRKPDGTPVPWYVNDDGTSPVSDAGVRERLDLLLALLAPTTFLHLQPDAQEVWLINHGLGFHPNVTTVDSTGRLVEGDVVYLSNSLVQVTFSAPFAGSAFLS
jgi:hypothetical protein